MTKRSKSEKDTPKKISHKDIDLANFMLNRRKEWRFGLSLPLIVEGKLPNGKTFKEITTIQNISSGGAYFPLDSEVTVGSKLNLLIDIPRELSGGKNLNLILGGLTVRIDKLNDEEKKQGIALRFYKKFRIISEDEE